VRDIVLQRAERPFIQTGFARHIRSAVVDKCPVGTPITVDDNRIGWRLLESSWMCSTTQFHALDIARSASQRKQV